MLRRLGSFADIFLRDSLTHPRADLAKVIKALHHRSVSVLSDEPLLIGNLLGLDAAQILNGGDGAVARRINRLWRLIPSGAHGIPNDILFRVGPRLTEPGLRWAPATLLIDNDVNPMIQSSEKEEDRAVLTPSDGLFVRLRGFRLSLAPGVKGLASPHESIEQLDAPDRLWVKDDAGSWYRIGRRYTVEQDSFLTDRTLAEVILQGNNLWVIPSDPEFPRPPTSNERMSIGLIVEVEPGERAEREGLAVKKAHAKLHIYVDPIPASISAEFALATAFSTQLISNSPALQKLVAIEDGIDEQSSLLLPSSKKDTLDELASEIHQLATTEVVKKAIAAAGSDFDISVMRYAIMVVLLSEYVCMGEKVPKSQPWYVD